MLPEKVRPLCGLKKRTLDHVFKPEIQPDPYFIPGELAVLQDSPLYCVGHGSKVRL